MHGISRLQITREISYRAVLKNVNYSINPKEIKTEIEKVRHMVTNVWNTKQYRTKISLSMFFCRTETYPK
jgi:hypothetical protein